MVAWMIPAAMVAASAIAGGASYLGSRQQNSANQAMNAGQMKYNWDVTQWEMANQRDMFQQSQDFNRTEALAQRDWATELSNTSYQRARRDMLAAGLNPILAYQQGGASSPSGQAASIGTPNASSHAAPAVHRMENALGPAVSSAMQAASTIGSLYQTEATIDQTRAQTGLTQAQEEQSRTAAALNSAQTAAELKRAGLLRAQQAESIVMPSLRNAQTTATNAQAALAGQQTATEREREQLTRDQQWETIQRGHRQAEETRQINRYGIHGGQIPGIGSSLGQLGEQLRRHVW